MIIDEENLCLRLFRFDARGHALCLPKRREERK
jgi:hypothetical protein